MFCAAGDRAPWQWGARVRVPPRRGAVPFNHVPRCRDKVASLNSSLRITGRRLVATALRCPSPCAAIANTGPLHPSRQFGSSPMAGSCLRHVPGTDLQSHFQARQAINPVAAQHWVRSPRPAWHVLTCSFNDKKPATKGGSGEAVRCPGILAGLLFLIQRQGPARRRRPLADHHRQFGRFATTHHLHFCRRTRL